MEAVDVFWHAEGMQTAFRGTVYYNGTEYDISPEKSYGYADKSWGKTLPAPWVFLSSSRLHSRALGKELSDSVFTVIGGSATVGGMLELSEKLMTGLWYEGEPYEFNFSKFWTLTRTEFKVKERKRRVKWVLKQETPLQKIRIEISCEKGKMLDFSFFKPDGSGMSAPVHSGGDGSGSIRLYRKKVSLRNKWEWELVDVIDVNGAYCQYGG